MLRTAVVASVACLIPTSLTRRAGNEKVATPEADEWAGKGRDVALGAPGLLEQIPIRNQREVEIEEQAEDRDPEGPLCQWRRQVGPPDPEAAAENHRQEDKEQQRPRNIPGRGLELRVNRIDGEGQTYREGDNRPGAQDH